MPCWAPALLVVLFSMRTLALKLVKIPHVPQRSVVLLRRITLLFCTERDTAKVRNLSRDPLVVLSIEDEVRNRAGNQQHLLVYGRAAVIDGPPEKALCDDLCRTYTGRADHPMNLSRSATAVTVAVEIDRIAGNGPWAT